MNKLGAIIRPEKLTSVKDALDEAGLVVSDRDTTKAIDNIMAKARTGSIGDGKIFITPMANAIRIRAGEKGDQAL